jgi:hypothetical protein
MGLRTWLKYKKIQWLGDNQFEKDGRKELPCEKCGNSFISYMRYGEWGYEFDSYCEGCR